MHRVGNVRMSLNDPARHPQNVVYHRYDRAYRPTIFGAMKRDIDKGGEGKISRRADLKSATIGAEEALKRVVQLLLDEEGGGKEGEEEGGRGLGRARTVKGYEAFANVSFRMREVGERAVTGMPPPP